MQKMLVSKVNLELAKGVKRTILDYKLSRYACYLIMQNADPKKNEENGYNKGNFFIMLGTGIIIICIELNEIRKRVSNQIDLIDNQ